jgi:hypothetical protein
MTEKLTVDVWGWLFMVCARAVFGRAHIDFPRFRNLGEPTAFDVEDPFWYLMKFVAKNIIVEVKYVGSLKKIECSLDAQQPYLPVYYIDTFYLAG